MTTLGDTYLNLADKLKRTEAGEQAAQIIEIMNQTNCIMQDANVIECNDGTSNITTIRTGLPNATFRRLYGYVQPSKSTTAQVKDTTGMLEAYSVVDKDLVDKSKSPKLFRMSESTPFIEAMNQTLQSEVFYGDTKVKPEGFDGLSVRYGKMSADSKNIGSNIINGGGTSNKNTSIWFVTWGDQHVSLTYPEGSKAGVQHEDDGIQTETDANGGKRKVYQDHFKVDVGLTVKDWRSTCRIANIDVEDLEGQTPADLADLMRKAYYKVKRHSAGGKTCIYCNTNVLMHFDKQVESKTNIHFSYQEYLNDEKVLTYKGIPIRACDQILDNEAKIS